MDILPVEIIKNILIWLPDYHLVLSQRVSILWYHISNEIINQRHTKPKQSWILADLIRRNEHSVVKRLVSNLTSKLKNTVCTFYAYLGDKDMINYCLEHGAEWTDRAIGYLIHGGKIELLEWIKEKLFLNPEIWKMAAYSGRLDVLGLIPDNQYPSSIVEHAVRGGHLDVVIWAVNRKFYYYYNVCEIAAENKYFDILEWFVRRDTYLNEKARFYAVHYGGYQILEQIGDSEPNEISLQLAASYGHLEILQKAVENGIKIPSWHITLAAMNGHMNIVQWGHNNGYLVDDELSCPSYYAAMGNHLDILVWLKDHDYQMIDSVCTYAAKNNNFEMLGWAINNECQITLNACSEASFKGHFEMVKWIINNGYPWSVQVFRGIISHNNMEMLIWLNEMIDQKISIPVDYQPKYYSWGKKIVAYAAECGNLKMIQWLLNNGYSYNKLACDSAAIGGHLEILKWLIKKGCPCTIPKRQCKSPHIDDRNIITETARNGHLDVFQWLVENIFPSSKWKLEYKVISTKETVCKMDDSKIISIKTNSNVIHWYQKYVLFNKKD